MSAIREMPRFDRRVAGEGVGEELATERLREGLSYEWRAERHIEAVLCGVSDRRLSPDVASRLIELTAAARARRTRLERRLKALGAGPRLAAIPPLLERVDQAIEVALASARASADRYAALAELSRRLADPETAFACELNRIGAEESALVLEGLLALEVDRRARKTMESGGRR